MITVERLRQWEKTGNEHKDRIHCFGSVSKNTVIRAEKDLDLAFPQVYCWFLMTYGHGFFGENEIFGLEEPYNPDKPIGIPNVVSVTRIFRQTYDIPIKDFVFAGDGESRYYIAHTYESRKQDAEIYAYDIYKNDIAPSLAGFEKNMILSEFLDTVFTYDTLQGGR